MKKLSLAMSILCFVLVIVNIACVIAIYPNYVFIANLVAAIFILMVGIYGIQTYRMMD